MGKDKDMEKDLDEEQNEEQRRSREGVEVPETVHIDQIKEHVDAGEEFPL